MNKPQLPTRRVWRDLALMVVVGAFLGLALNQAHNALHRVFPATIRSTGINLSIAYGLSGPEEP